MYWEDLLRDVLSQEELKENKLPYKNPSSGTQLANKQSTKFFLGEAHHNIYFTTREADVMIQLLLGKTLTAAAKKLNLSPRTIEFYVKNMKTKLSCRTKSELIGKVFASDFVKNVKLIAHMMEK